jgi:hypothetical protein
MPLRVSRTFSLPVDVVGAGAVGQSITMQVASTSPLSPRPLTGEEQTIVALIAQLGATFVAMTGGSAAEFLFVGLVLYLLLREFTRRCLPPGD